jgi:hypothetical protein
MRARRVGAVAVVVALLSAGYGGSRPILAAPTFALGLPRDEAGRFGFDRLPPGTYVAYGMRTAVVHRPLRILSIRPVRHSADVEFVSAHVMFLQCPTCRPRPGTYGTKILLGSACGPTDLHSRAMVPAVGLDLYPGDAPSFILVGRFRSGVGSIEGARITYRVGSRTETVTSLLHSADATGSAPPEGVAYCGDPQSAWYGGSDELAYTSLW